MGPPLPTSLPIEGALPALLDAMARAGQAVLQAPPGAGKTTRVPLALLEARAFQGRLVMLEPRRIAARTAAERMADMRGERVGETVGFRVRGETRIGAGTRIEVVTEGVLTRMIQSDPDLPGIGALIFDEFHERSLQAELGLALALEARAALRPDLQLLVMSATLDAEPVAALMGDAPVITSPGRAFPVETRWLPRPGPGPGARARDLAEAAARLVLQALGETRGGILVFLPGEAEIRRTAGLLSGRLPDGVMLRPLYGALPFAEQRAAIAPERTGRKLVLATAIAETSLTIEDIRVVIDAGRARRSRFDPGSGMARLVTERVTRAEADQRRGRAGRVAPGVCYRMWMKAEEGGLSTFPPPEIVSADLTGLALELAVWGANDADDMAFLTRPDPGAMAAARALLGDLGALDRAGRVTPHGRAMAQVPLHPRLAHMLRSGDGAQARSLAALMAARDPMPGAGADLSLRLEALERQTVPGGKGAAALARIRDEARRLPKPDGPVRSVAELAALAYPDRVAMRRSRDSARYLLAGGKGARIDTHDPLARSRLLVVIDLDGDGTEALIRLALPLTEAELRGLYADRINWHDLCDWSRRDRRVLARRQERFGALVLDDRIWHDCPPERIAAAALDGVRDLGFAALAPSPQAQRLLARLRFLSARGRMPDLPDLPDLSEQALLDTAAHWLLPDLTACRTADDLARIDVAGALSAWLGYDRMQVVDRLAPASFTTPAGRKVPVNYAGDRPEISVRLQDLFGLNTHPRVGPDGLPLTITLLSPANRPLQTTADLPGFWRSSYADVRKDMRGRYPKHRWPEDPLEASPDTRSRPRAR